MPEPHTTVTTIEFSNGRKAVLAMADPDATGKALVEALGITARPLVVMIFGGAESLSPAIAETLRATFMRSIMPVIAQRDGLIIDGGTASGVMAIAGEVADCQPKRPILLGVAPLGKARYPGGDPLAGVEDAAELDAHHSHFVLSQSEAWGSEIDVMFAIATALANTSMVIALVAGGGPKTKAEVLRAVQAGWTVVALEETGGFSEELICLSDPDMAAIARTADLHKFPASETAAAFEKILGSRCDAQRPLLEAWERLTNYDLNAVRFQKIFGRLQMSIVLLGVLGVTLAVLKKQWEPATSEAELLGIDMKSWDVYLHNAIVVIPVITAVLLGISHQFKFGDKWILLRGAAEAVRGQIFRYRSRAGGYGESVLKGTSPEVHLIEQLKTINQRLTQTEMRKIGLKNYPAELPEPATDDGLSILTAEQYIELRLNHQFGFYSGRAIRRGRQHFWLTILSLVCGGAGTVLAALYMEIWVAVSTALATAFITYLKNYQTEETVALYNRAKGDLADVKSWWTGFSAFEKRDPRNKAMLVELTERVLEQETAGWSQRMIDALTEMRRDEDKRQKEQDKTESAKPKKQKAEPTVKKPAHKPKKPATGKGKSRGKKGK